jgi:hypothetical protein
MDKRFVIPGLYRLESEQTAFVTASDADFTINGKVVTSQATTSIPAPITPNAGSITTMTIRTVSALPSAYVVSRQVTGNLVTLRFPAFAVSAISGTISALTFTQAIEKPPFGTQFTVPVLNAGAVVNGQIEIIPNGNILLVPGSGANFTTGFGFPDDVSITYSK